MQQDEDPEIWLPVVGFPLYEVSSHGRVRRNPANPSHLPREALAACTTKTGRYPRVVLMRGAKTFSRNVQQLVCEAFHGKRPGPDFEAANLSNTPENTRADNVAWRTRIDGRKARRAHGSHREGETIPWAKLKATDIPVIRARLANRESMLKIAADYGVSEGAINYIRTGRNWKHV